MIYRSRALLVALILFIFLPSSASAQYFDPAAEAHAWALYRAYESADTYTFEQLLVNDQQLSRKAFLYVIYYMGQNVQSDPEAFRNANDFGVELASYLEMRLRDPVPSQIMTALANQNRQGLEQVVAAYMTDLYGEQANQATISGAGSSATPFPLEGASDPAARKWAQDLYQAFLADDGSAQVLMKQDPVLTKKAYLSIAEYIFQEYRKNPNGDFTNQGLALGVLAQQIQAVLGDPVPAQIFELLASDQEGQAEQLILSYAKSVYSAGTAVDLGVGTLTNTATNNQPSTETPSGDLFSTSTTVEKYGESRVSAAQIPEMAYALIRPMLLKFVRLLTGLTYSDPALIVQELDTFEPVMTATLASVGEEFDKSQFEDGLKAIRLQFLAEFGMVNEFSEQADQMAAEMDDPNSALIIYVTGFNMNLRQHQHERAADYLTKIRQTIQANPKASPVFSFIRDTAEFQLKKATGGGATPEQTVAAFDKAWANLDRYQAFENVNHDITWRYGRAGGNYWIQELVKLGEKGKPGQVKIFEDISAWLAKAPATFQTVTADFSHPDDMMLRSVEFQGVFNALFATMDMVLSLYEERPDIIGGSEAFINEAAQIVQLGEMTDAILPLDPGGAGFPPFSVKNSTEMKKMRTRIAFLQALFPQKSESQRVTELQAVAVQMEALELPADYIRYHLRLGQAYKNLGRSELATAAWEKAYKKAEQMRFLSEATEASALLVEEYGSTGNWEKASLYADKANAGMQEVLGSSEEMTGISMAIKAKSLSEIGAKAAIKSNDPKKALAILSEGEQLNSAAVQLSGDGEGARASKELQKKKTQVATLSSKVESLKQLPESPTRNEMLKKAQTLLAETESQFLLQSRNLRQKFSNLYTTTLRFDPLNLPDVQAALPADAAVVQYFATDEELYIFVVTKSDFRLRSVKETKENLDRNITAFLKDVQKPGMGAQKLEVASTALYQTLVAPIEEDLAKSNTVVLIPSGKLNVLPFAPLKGPDGKMFLEKKTLLELAKPTDFMKIASTEAVPVKSVVAFANATKDLPSAEMEGENITEIFPQSKLFKREEATKANLMKFGSQAEVLHLATHGVWDANNSLNNYLKLSNGERLAQEEIFELNLSDTSIVTLSACSTALADAKEVEYVASLAEAFWIAGSRSVVASLWPVDDASTGLLMTRFYENLRAGDGKAEALRKAQLALKSDDRFAHPYFWSGFLLFGDYR